MAVGKGSVSDVCFDDLLGAYERKRMKELLAEVGGVKEVECEKVLLKKTKKDTLLVHFYHEDFARCKEMREGLEILARKYQTIEFLQVKAENCPFICERLEIRALPYLASFTKGFFIGGIVGFEDIGEDRLDLSLLETYIKQSDLLDNSAEG